MTQYKFNKEKFIKDIHTFPVWVKDHEAIASYLIHMKYRIYELEAQKEWLEKKFIKDEKPPEYEKIHEDHIDAYLNCKGEAVEFSERCLL